MQTLWKAGKGDTRKLGVIDMNNIESMQKMDKVFKLVAIPTYVILLSAISITMHSIGIPVLFTVFIVVTLTLHILSGQSDNRLYPKLMIVWITSFMIMYMVF